MIFLKNYKNKIVITVVLGIFTAFICGSSMEIYGKDKAVKEKVELNAFLQNDDIVIEAMPIDKTSKSDTMKSTQIWGDYGRGWVLIKDYNSQSDSQKFVWDLKSLDKDNESYYVEKNDLKTDSKVYKYTEEDTDMFKIYVRYKGNSNQEELYKTFYLGSPLKDVQLTADYESNQNDDETYVNDFPVVVTQGKIVELYLKTDDDSKAFEVKILGEDYQQILYEKEDKIYEWTPKESGTFNIAVFDSDSNIILKRKVYVNSQNNEYLQLGDISIVNQRDVVYVRLKVLDTIPSGYDSKLINKSLRFTISEPSVWAKTIKDYGNVIDFNKTYNAYEISEKKDLFTFGSGIYSVNSYIKTPHSIEPDDVVSKTYKSKVTEVSDFDLNFSCENGKPDKKDNSYSLSKNQPLKFKFSIKKPDTQYEYAFFLQDAREKKIVKDYSDVSDFSWSPADTGQYTVFSRIRLKKPSGSLPNSYEKEVSVPIIITDSDKLVKISSVKINDNEWNVNEGSAVLQTSGDKILAHSINVIDITAEDSKSKQKKDNLMYKVYAVGNGYTTSLGAYTFSNKIPFYPKSPGRYQLIVMVKNSESGSQEDKCEINLEVK